MAFPGVYPLQKHPMWQTIAKKKIAVPCPLKILTMNRFCLRPGKLEIRLTVAIQATYLRKASLKMRWALQAFLALTIWL